MHEHYPPTRPGQPIASEVIIMNVGRGPPSLGPYPLSLTMGRSAAGVNAGLAAGCEAPLR